MMSPFRSRAPFIARVRLLAIGGFVIWNLGFGIWDLGFSQEVAAFDKLQPGMTPEQVREQLGPPKRIARQFLYHRYLEQWTYDRPIATRLQFDCPRGQKPRLLWKHVSR